MWPMDLSYKDSYKLQAPVFNQFSEKSVSVKPKVWNQFSLLFYGPGTKISQDENKLNKLLFFYIESSFIKLGQNKFWKILERNK